MAGRGVQGFPFGEAFGRGGDARKKIDDVLFLKTTEGPTPAAEKLYEVCTYSPKNDKSRDVEEKNRNNK